MHQLDTTLLPDTILDVKNLLPEIVYTLKQKKKNIHHYKTIHFCSESNRTCI